MGLRINTNVLALQAQSQLSKSTGKLGSALERLSSGLRINKGSDDVVGLLKSETLRSQIRGIGAAESNLANGTNLLGVAEGSLAQLTDVAQRIREAVVGAADDTISGTDRANIGTSVNDLLNEFSRLVNASDFGGVKLLTGTFTGKQFQVGPNAADTISFSLSDTRSSNVGKVAVLTAKVVTLVAIDGTSVTLADPSGVVVNGYTITASSFTSDGVSNIESSDSALAYVNAINSFSGLTGVRASILANVVTIDYLGHGDLDASDTISINGVAIAQAAYSDTDTGASNIATAINAISTQTGVSATMDSATDIITLTATDGRNINVKFQNGLSTARANLWLFGGTSMSDSYAAAIWRGTFKLSSDSVFTTSGATDEISNTTSASLSSATTLNNLSVATAGNAAEGIFILDNVIRQLQTRRADVGSKTIRFGVAASELAVRKENLTSSESRIRDADIAVETANLTSAQILQQAGATVLARANSVPQIALTLLQG